MTEFNSNISLNIPNDVDHGIYWYNDNDNNIDWSIGTWLNSCLNTYQTSQQLKPNCAMQSNVKIQPNVSSMKYPSQLQPTTTLYDNAGYVAPTQWIINDST